LKLECPIRSVDLPGVSDVELRGLLVVVGPNSSGKTQFLRDLNDVVLGRARKLVVATAVSYNRPPPFKAYLDSLLANDIIREKSSDEFQKRSLQYGADEGSGSFRKSRLESHHEQFSIRTADKIEGTVCEFEYLKELGPLSCTALFLKNRLTLMDAGSTFDHLKDGPSRTVQSLYWNKTAKDALCVEISDVFLRSIWVDNTRHHQLVIRVADSPQLPSADDRLEPEIMEQYRTIESEGDGLRSYSAICATLLLEQRPLCLIDEPEMCLHPPQADAMGRFIGLHAPEDTCTVVATHSSHILRGILDTRPKAHVIRLSRLASGFRARTLSPELLEDATSKPRSRSEVILEGLLSNAVILCEAEGDRIVYASTFRTLKDRRLDIRFIPSEGTGGLVDPLRAYSGDSAHLFRRKAPTCSE
jgi:hypothetical protein